MLIRLSRGRGTKREALVVAMVFAAVTLAILHISGHFAWEHLLRITQWSGELPAPTADDRVLVIAPHPDDEVLGCAGLIRRSVVAGADLQVGLLTNGDASELSLIFAGKVARRTPVQYRGLGEIRQRETLAALAALGVPPRHVHFLGYPNNGLQELLTPEHWSPERPYTSPYTGACACPYSRAFTPDAVYCGEQLRADMEALLSRTRPTMLFVVLPEDIHPDHRATAEITVAAVAGLLAQGTAWTRELSVYGYLIHWPHWPTPRGYSPALGLLPPAALNDRTWLELPLSPTEEHAKDAAIRCYHSQKPNLDRLLLAFVRTNECFAQLGEADLPVALPPPQ